MEEASRKLARGDAAAAAVDLIEELVEKQKAVGSSSGQEAEAGAVGRKQEAELQMQTSNLKI